MFLQDLCQFATDRNLTDIIKKDRHDSAHQVHQPGDADKITKLDKTTDVGVVKQLLYIRAVRLI